MAQDQQPGEGRDRLVEAALASGAIPNRLAYAGRAVLNGFWLGVLNEDRLRALDEHYFRTAAVYRTPEWNEQGLFTWEDELIRTHFPADGRIAVLACGGGREVLALRRAGRDAVGFESHPDLVAYAEAFLSARGHPGCVVAVPRDLFPTSPEPFAAIIIGWGAYSLILGRDTRVALLESVRDNLVAGGLVLLSGFERPSDHREVRITRSVANALRRVRRAAPLELGDTLGPSVLHAFGPGELADEAACAGFVEVEHRVTSWSEPTTAYAAAVLRSAHG